MNQEKIEIRNTDTFGTDYMPATVRTTAVPPLESLRSSAVNQLCVILVFNGEDARFFEERLRRSRRAAAQMDIAIKWIVVCDGILPLSLNFSVWLEEIKVSVISTSSRRGDWPALYEGMLRSGTAWCLLLPADSCLLQEDLQEMIAETNFCVSVSRPRGRAFWGWRLILAMLGGSHHNDLAAPCLIKRQVFIAAAAHYERSQVLFGYRVFSKLRAAKAKHIELPASKKRISLADTLGVDPSRSGRLGVWFYDHAVLGLVSLYGAWILAWKNPTFGLPLLGLSALWVAVVVGKDE